MQIILSKSDNSTLFLNYIDQIYIIFIINILININLKRRLSSEHSTINTPFWALLTSIYAIQDLSLGQDLFIVISISQWP